MPKMLTDRAAIVAEAASLADQGGPDQLTFNALAERLQVSPGAIYHHVGDAAGLRAAVAATSMRELGEHVVESTIGLAGQDAVGAVIDVWRRWATEHEARYELASSSGSAESDEVADGNRNLIRLLTTILERAGCDPDDAPHAARYLRSAVHGFVMLEISDGFVLDDDVDESFLQLRRRLISGLVGE